MNKQKQHCRNHNKHLKEKNMVRPVQHSNPQDEWLHTNRTKTKTLQESDTYLITSVAAFY